MEIEDEFYEQGLENGWRNHQKEVMAFLSKRRKYLLMQDNANAFYRLQEIEDIIKGIEKL